MTPEQEALIRKVLGIKEPVQPVAEPVTENDHA